MTTRRRLREPIQCWGCGEDYLNLYWPHTKKNSINMHNIQAATTIDDVRRTSPRIYAPLKEYQVDHQLTMVEVEVKATKKFLSILIEP
jgi:hypothetical protein